ncbi:hypothetical protein JXO52_12160 [bacterium]|nr:hypothetical protein [bacterium]
MKRCFLFAVLLLALVVLGCQNLSNPVGTEPADTSTPAPLLKGGFDEFGYNYQAHIFNGRYCDYDRVIGGPYEDVTLVMKWNEAWMSNKDTDGDGNYDRHLGFDTYIGSGAWCTNHQSGGEGKDHWTYFVKIVAAPADAVKEGGYWYAADGAMLGPDIWGQFIVVQRVESGIGVYDKSPVGPGLGKW